MKKSLKDKIVFISGASSGFGADAARLFAREGCLVILAARRMERLQDLAELIKKEGGQALSLDLDVADGASIQKAVQQVLDLYGRIDILINNAGLGRLDWLETLDPYLDIEPLIDVNLKGLIELTRAVLPSMLAHRSGTIINVSSVAGLIAAPTYSIYAATKYGVRGFTEALRREVAPFNLNIVGFYPGPAKTEFGLRAGTSAIKKNMKTPDWLYLTSETVARRMVALARHPRRRLVTPWYYAIADGFDALFPGLVDWFLKVAFVKRFHKYP